MNPIGLLTKGRTIRGFGKRASVYSLQNMGVAPNFSTGKVKSPTPPHSPPQVSSPTPPRPSPQVLQSTLFEKPQQPATAPAMRPPAVAPVPSWPRTAWRRLVEFCGRIAQRWSGPRKTSPFQNSTVQTELELAKVKVVRNDLSDDDLELVPVAKNEKPRQHEQCQAISTDQ
jgi:hypothetical protein